MDSITIHNKANLKPLIVLQIVMHIISRSKDKDGLYAKFTDISIENKEYTILYKKGKRGFIFTIFYVGYDHGQVSTPPTAITYKNNTFKPSDSFTLVDEQTTRCEVCHNQIGSSDTVCDHSKNGYCALFRQQANLDEITFNMHKPYNNTVK